MTSHRSPPIDPRIAAAALEGCEESRLLLSRRSMMGLTAAFFSSALIPRSALASSTDKRLLIVILRGGMDGLNVVMPKGNSSFLEHRGPLVQALGPRIQLKGGAFELHPSLRKFGELFNRDQAAIVHAIAPPLQNRSHFQCQYNLESGMGPDNPYVPTGWLNRAVSKMSAVDSVGLQGAFAYGNTPFILAGGSPVHSWSLAGGTKLPQAHRELLTAYYRKNAPLTGKALLEGVDLDNSARQMSENSALESLATEVVSTVSELRKAFRSVAGLMANDAGPRIGVLSIDGWDTHITTNSMNDHGGMAAPLAAVDRGIMDFQVQAGEAIWNKTVIVCVSEFGRTIELNSRSGSAGSEHGRGTVALLAGGGLGAQGPDGNFYNEAPNLSAILAVQTSESAMLGRHEIPVEKDTRALFKSILIDFLGMDEAPVENDVFPASSHQPKLDIRYRTS